VAGWDKPYVYVLLIVSILIIGLFLFVEMKTEEPIMPPSIWTVAGFPGVLACIALGWSSFGVFIYYIIQFIEISRGVLPLLTTAMMSPIIISGLSATIVVSILYDRVPGHYLLMASMCFFCTGNILVATVPVDQTYWAQVFVATLVTPFGMDISYPAASLIVSNTIPAHQQGVAASMVNTAINWSISLGLGIAGTVESQILKNGDTLEGFRSALYVGIGLSGMGIIVAFLFCRVPAKHNSNEHESSPADAITPTAASEAVVNFPAINGGVPDGEFPMTTRF
jgi:MFS family permease